MATILDLPSDNGTFTRETPEVKERKLRARMIADRAYRLREKWSAGMREAEASRLAQQVAEFLARMKKHKSPTEENEEPTNER